MLVYYFFTLEIRNYITFFKIVAMRFASFKRYKRLFILHITLLFKNY